MSGRSVATYNDPEFLNVTAISPLVSKCDIKVLYLGGNRNGSFITKERATSMAESLRGCPIVGHYIEDKEDFGGHGQQLIIDDEGFHFQTQTKPYGFVSLDSKIWFKDFIDTDEFGTETQRTYLMCEGYIWTGQFPELQGVVDFGKGQSMELDEQTLKGHWSEDTKSGIEFFIIDDAIFSKLCILGDDVEPCFEGASVNASTDYSLDNGKEFTHSLYSMMKDLKEVLTQFSLEGGNTSMNENEKLNEEIVEETAQKVLETPNSDFTAEAQVSAEGEAVSSEGETAPAVEDSAEEKNSENLDENIENDFSKNENIIEGENSNEEVVPVVETVSKEEYSLLEEKFNNLQSEYDALKNDYDSLYAFKKSIEDQEKLDLIQKEFSMLSVDDTAEILENRDKYSLNEIKSQLSVIYFDKYSKKEETPVAPVNNVEVPTTFSLDAINASTVSDPIAAALLSARKQK